MIQRLKYRLLRWLSNDVCTRLTERRGYLYIGDVKTCVTLNAMAMEAYGVKEDEK